MKLALGIISEGDHPNLKRAVKSVYKYVEHIFITTTKINKPQWNDPKITWSYFLWNDDFSAVRNFNLKTIPKGFTHYMWIDSDDIVQNAEVIPEVVQSMELKGLDHILVDYNYDINSEGQVNIVHPRERIIRLGSYFWKAKLHETLIPNRKVRHLFIKDFYIDHYPTKENKDNGIIRNLRILQKDYESQRKDLVAGKIEEIDPRSEYYLARCLYDTHTDVGFKRAFQLFQDYLEHSGWDEERAFAWNYIGNIQYNFKKYEDSTISYLTAIKERPEFPTWHINLSRSYCALKDFSKAEHHIKVGTNMEQPKTSMILTPREDKINSLIVLFYVFFEKKDFVQAKKAATMLLEMQPTEENEKRIESIEKLEKWTHWMQSVAQMSQELYEKGDIDKVESLLKGLPKDVEHTVMADTLRSQYTRPRIWPKKSIAYYAAIDIHQWSPKSLKTGVGGSEQAIINLSKQWTKLGYEVVVYTNVGADEGEYDGVKYLNFYRFNNKDQFDIVIAWRNPHFIHKNLLDARLVLLDLHDVPEKGEFSKDLLNRIDYIMVKSDYHRTLLPEVPDNKFKIINNGINWKFLQSFGKDKLPHRCGFFSSYDRGLEGLLDIWPDVRREILDAELHIAYGWDLFLKLRGHVKKYKDWYFQMVEKMKQPGIFEHGKLGEKDLYSLAGTCSLLTYPSTFCEIDCITARYCQAVATVPLVYNYSALATTVQRGVRLAVDPFDRKSIQVYKEKLIELLKNPLEIKDIRENAKSFDWKEVADKWIEVFEEEKPQDIKLTVFTPTIRTGFWNVMADNLSKQTYKNFEWLIIDDYKEDRKEIAKKYAEKYKIDIRYMRGKLNRSKYNYALIQADNMAIYNSTGSVIVWLQDFILIPNYGLERIVRLHRRYPTAIIAPVDQYNSMSIKPNRKNKEDWFDGKTDVVGKLIRKNIRIKLGEVRQSLQPNMEMNYGAIPVYTARKLNGLWEFQDDGLGFNERDITTRALMVNFMQIIDERNVATCLDLWEHLTGEDENAKDREWNLNDARYQFIYMATKMGILPIVRDANIDRKIKLDNKMPKGLDQEGAAKWIQKNQFLLAKKWIKEFV